MLIFLIADVGTMIASTTAIPKPTVH